MRGRAGGTRGARGAAAAAELPGGGGAGARARLVLPAPRAARAARLPLHARRALHGARARAGVGARQRAADALHPLTVTSAETTGLTRTLILKNEDIHGVGFIIRDQKM